MKKQDKYIAAFKAYLLRSGPLAPDQGDAIATSGAVVRAFRGATVPGFPGDLFYVAEGLLKEVQDGTLADRFKPSIQRLLKEGDVFFIPFSGQRNTLVAVEDTVMVRLGRMDVVRLRRQYPPLVERFEGLYTTWYDQLILRYELLRLPKKSRYARFLKLLPRLAARLLDKDVMAYLDISEGYANIAKR